VIAEEWFRVFQDVSEARTLGWLLGKRPDKAADYAWRKYPDSMAYPRPEQGWMYQIFDHAWPTIERDPAVTATLDIGATLEQNVKAAEKIFMDGLQKIQQRYEGGKPFV
jgi:hypothetical protein